MPRVPNRLKLPSLNVVGTGTTTATTGAQGTPFIGVLTDDGSDSTLNEDYSGAATDAAWTASRDAVLTFMNICIGDSDVAQFTTISGTSRFLGDLNAVTNGVVFTIKNESNAIVQYLTHPTFPLRTTNELVSFSTDNYFGFSTLGSATSTNNYAYLALYVDIVKKFGGGLVVPSEHKVVCTLNDNFSSLSSFTIHISGFYL